MNIKLPPLPPHCESWTLGAIQILQAYATAAVEQDRQARGESVAVVAEVHMSRYTLEWTNGPLPEKTLLYAFPTPKESALLQALEALERPRSPQSWYSRACTDADAAKALREAIYTTPQPAHSEAEVQEILIWKSASGDVFQKLVRRILGVEAPK